jgi:cytochrome c-type biogenesis protein CcmH/NrfG
MDLALLSPRSDRGWNRRMTWSWSVRLRVAHRLGRMLGWLRGSGRLPALILAVPLILVALPLSWVWWKILLLYGGLMMVVWALWGAHRRVVIEAFDDYRAPAPPAAGAEEGEEGGGDQSASSAKDSGAAARKDDGGAVRKDAGTAVLLANRLAHMRELYDFVDDPDETPVPNRATGAAVQLDDAGSVLRSAVTTDSTVSLGPISLPFGALMGLLGRFVQAPRLRGAIHGDERRLVVTAELTMDGQPYSWRVPARVEDGSPADAALDALVEEELAYQVFSDLTLQRQARWPATRYWLEALGKMADCQRRPRNRHLLLREAESRFNRALAEDERFYLACLNLGIVNRRLGEYAAERRDGDPRDKAEARRAREERRQRYVIAARRVFERAIKLQPDRWEAYHALAEALWATSGTRGSLEMVPGLCDRALALGPDPASAARILDLSAHAQEAAARAAEDEAEAAAARRLAVETREYGCWLLLRELERTSLAQGRTRQARRTRALRNQASQCLVNLAESTWNEHTARRALTESKRRAKRDRAAFEHAYAIARLAVRLADVDAAAHDRLAGVAEEAGRLDVAVAELSAAARIAPAKPLYAAKLAHAFARSRDRSGALEACARARRLIDFGDERQRDAHTELIAAYRELGDEDEARMLESRGRLTRELESAARRGSFAAANALARLIGACGTRRDWEAARARQELGWRHLEDEALGSAAVRGREAELLFTKALEWFEVQQPDDPRVAMLYSDRARALALQPGRSGEALADAGTAVTLDPLSPRYRRMLARAYAAGGDLDHACEAAGDALLLDPDNPDLHFDLAHLRWQRAETLADPVLHAEERNEAISQFRAALTLYDADQREKRRTTHWWLAMSYFAVSDFKAVPAHLRFVLSSLTPDDGVVAEERGIEAAAELWLGQTYRKLQKYGEAEEHLARAIEVAERLADADVAVAA